MNVFTFASNLLIYLMCLSVYLSYLFVLILYYMDYTGRATSTYNLDAPYFLVRLINRLCMYYNFFLYKFI